MSGILIQARGGVTSAEELFDEGFGALKGQLFARCEDKLRKYLRYFPHEVSAHAAYYNLGLCMEFQRKYAQAADQFRMYAQLAERSNDRLDGEFRLGYNLIFSAQYQKAKILYTRLLTTEPIKGLDRAECHLRRAMAHSALTDYAEADEDLSLAMSHTNSILGPHRQGNEILAEIYFQRGEVYRQHMGKIELKMPLLRLKRNLTDKKRFFRKSMYSLLECIKVAHTYWAIAAGHQLGVLHEDIYEDLMQAEPPSDFDEETLAYYYFRLEERIAPLVRESISIYEKTVTISAAQGAQNEWVKSTRESLKRLRDLEAHLQMRLALDPLEAYKIRKVKPLKRGKVTVPLPPPRYQRKDTPHQSTDDQPDQSDQSRDRTQGKDDEFKQSISLKDATH